MGWLDRLDRLIGQIVGVTRWLALPLILLLFLQWPLRDLVRCCSREANDLGQIIFAVFVAVSVTAVTRERTHLASDVLAQRFSPRTRQRLRQMAALLGVLPWALFVFVASKPFVASSVLGLEAFPDSYNSGYFIIKAALWLMTFLLIAQALLDLFRHSHPDDA